MIRSQTCVFAALVSFTALAFGQHEAVVNPATCWDRANLPATLGIPVPRAGQCVRVLTVPLGWSSHVAIEQALEVTATGTRPDMLSWALEHRPPGQRPFGVTIEQLSIDISPWLFALVEGRWEPDGSGNGSISGARISSVTMDRALKLVPELATRVATVRAVATQLPPEPFPESEKPTWPFAQFPDAEGLRTLLSRLTHKLARWPRSINYSAIADLALARLRAPALIDAHAKEIGAAFLDANRELRSYGQGVHVEAYCFVLGECREFRARAVNRFETTDAGPNAEYRAHTQNRWLSDMYPRLAIDWLSDKRVWGPRERAVFRHWLADPLEQRFQIPGMPLPLDPPVTKPEDWPSARDVQHDVSAAEWRALTSGDRWAHLGTVAIAGESEDSYVGGEPPGPPPPDVGPAAAQFALSLVNLGTSPVRVRSDAARLLARRGTWKADLSNAVDVEIPPRRWVVWRGHFDARRSLPVRETATLVLVLRADGRTATVKMPFKVTAVV